MRGPESDRMVDYSAQVGTFSSPQHLSYPPPDVVMLRAKSKIIPIPSQHLSCTLLPLFDFFFQYENVLLFKCMYFALMMSSSGVLALLLLFILIQIPYTHDMYGAIDHMSLLRLLCIQYKKRKLLCIIRN
jgi:hypothetical protein